MMHGQKNIKSLPLLGSETQVLCLQVRSVVARYSNDAT